MTFPDFPDIGDIISWKMIIVVCFVCILRQYLKGTQFRGNEKAKKKVIVVTGCSVGIGKQIARELNQRGAKVYMACRNAVRGEEAVAELAKLGCPPDKLVFLPLDLANFASIRTFVEQLTKCETQIDVLVNNAGVMMVPKFKLTVDGHETQWQTNYLGHFYLTQLLTPLLQAANSGARVVNVSCPAHFAGDLNTKTLLESDGVDQKEMYDSRAAFSRSKLAMVLHAKALTKVLRRGGADNVTVNACSPGLCFTRHFRHLPLAGNKFLKFTLSPFAWFLLKTPKDGAQTPLYCVLASELDGVSGKYYSECKEKEPSSDGQNEDLANYLYDYSLRACGIGSRESQMI